MKLTTTVKAPVLDMFSRDWEFEGKKGTAHFVVIYDYDNHTSERLVIDSAMISFLILYQVSIYFKNIRLLLFLMKLMAS